jgi:hypothetical protein
MQDLFGFVSQGRYVLNILPSTSFLLFFSFFHHKVETHHVGVLLCVCVSMYRRQSHWISWPHTSQGHVTETQAWIHYDRCAQGDLQGLPPLGSSRHTWTHERRQSHPSPTSVSRVCVAWSAVCVTFTPIRVACILLVCFGVGPQVRLHQVPPLLVVTIQCPTASLPAQVYFVEMACPLFCKCMLHVCIKEPCSTFNDRDRV